MEGRITMASVRSNTDLVSFSEGEVSCASLRLNVAFEPPPAPNAKRQRLWKLINNKVFQNEFPGCGSAALWQSGACTIQ